MEHHSRKEGRRVYIFCAFFSLSLGLSVGVFVCSVCAIWELVVHCMKAGGQELIVIDRYFTPYAWHCS